MALPSVFPEAALAPLTSLVTTADPAGLLPAREQMALSLGWHIVLACFGVAFPAMILLAHWRGAWRGDEVAMRLAKRWSKVAAVLFAIGAGVTTSGTLAGVATSLWPVVVTVRAVATADGARLEVVDEGPGIPPAEAARVFERFYRSDSARASADGGAGLGLAIAQWITELHGGEISVVPSAPHGCRMVATIPGPVDLRPAPEPVNR